MNPPALTGPEKSLELTKKQLQTLFSGSKMMFESIDGVILYSWNKYENAFYIDGVKQTKENGFDSYWKDYDEIECMSSIALLHFHK